MAPIVVFAVGLGAEVPKRPENEHRTVKEAAFWYTRVLIVFSNNE